MRYFYPKSSALVTSPLDFMPQAYRLSRLTHLPNPEDFESYIISPLNPIYEEDDTTACLCLDHYDTNAFIEWASNWPSSLSVVMMIERGDRGSRRELRESLKKLSKLPALRQKLFLHVYTKPVTGPVERDSLLNLARIFAPTRRVVLFPFVPSSGGADCRTIIIPPRAWNETDTRIEHIRPHFLIPSGATNDLSIGNFPNSTALIMDRDSTVWCPERFISKWTECLWSLWLSSFGHFESSSCRLTSTVDIPSLEEQYPVLERINIKLAPRYRTEACIHLARNLAALDEWNLDNPKASWIREHCDSALREWGQSLL